MGTIKDAPGAMWNFECENALASARIEGFEPDEAFMRLWWQRVDCKITGDEFIRIVIRQAQEEDRAISAAAARAVA
jgi:hypothetical protein